MLQGGEVQRLWATVGADVTEYLQKMDRVEQQGRKTGQTLEKALSMIGVGMGVEGVRRILDATFAMADLGAQTMRVQDAYQALAGPVADEMLAGLRRASHGAIDDANLMLAANKAMLLEVTQDADEMAKLLDVAAARGKAMGLSTQQAFGDIVTGIGRMSPMILDNLGILTGGQKGFDDYAKSIGKTSAELTDLEKRHYLLNKVLEDTATQTLKAAQAQEDAATKFERSKAGGENLRAGFGSMLAEGPTSDLAGWWGRATSAVGGYFAEIAAGRRVVRELDAEFKAVQDSLTGADRMQLDFWLSAQDVQLTFGKTSADLRREWEALIATSPELVAVFEEHARVMAMTELSAANLRSELRDLRNERDLLATGPAIDQEALWGYTFEFASSGEQQAMLQDKLAAATVGSKDYYDILKQLTRHENAAADAQWSWTYAMASSDRQLGMLREKLAGLTVGSKEYYDVLTQLARAEQSSSEKGARAAEQAARQWQQQQERLQAMLRSQVEGVLQPTGVTELDMARTRLGVYQDQWDEYVRRLRSAADYADSAYRDLIPTDILEAGADAIRVWVAETEQAFYAGQLPELIDWDAFDRKLQQELARQQSREQLIQTAMTRAGGMASKEQITMALGLPITPSEALTMDLSGIGAKVHLGKPITDAFEKQLAAESKRWEEMGAMAILWFSRGAEAGVNPATGRNIARALFPFLAELLDQERP